jgi:5-bromo-4-chloroindolyl phosphate hydrolysis protein
MQDKTFYKNLKNALTDDYTVKARQPANNPKFMEKLAEAICLMQTLKELS